jgi:hypothetical protein
MTCKTGQQIERDIFAMFSESPVRSRLRGGVYRYGMRPCDSGAEDAVVGFAGGDPDKIESGSVMIRIYVPGCDFYGDGVVRCDKERCEALETAANEWVNSMTSIRQGYRLGLERIVSTEQEHSSGQHFVAVRLKYKLIN